LLVQLIVLPPASMLPCFAMRRVGSSARQAKGRSNSAAAQHTKELIDIALPPTIVLTEIGSCYGFICSEQDDNISVASTSGKSVDCLGRA
jgi:hypothetical protein